MPSITALMDDLKDREATIDGLQTLLDEQDYIMRGVLARLIEAKHPYMGHLQRVVIVDECIATLRSYLSQSGRTNG